MFESPNEHCWVLIGHTEGDLWYGRMHKMTSGAPCSVAFDADWVMKREEEHGDIVGFLHTHPGMAAFHSSRDDRTMWAWVCSFGKPLACLINGVDGLRAWWYIDDESPPEEYQVKRLDKLMFGVTPALYDERLNDFLMRDEEAIKASEIIERYEDEPCKGTEAGVEFVADNEPDLK